MLVPSAPCLLPELTGGSVPDLAGVRDAVGQALSDLVAAQPDRVVVAARAEPGTLAGFGAGQLRRDGGAAALRRDGVRWGWAHELGALLLSRRGWRADVDAADATGFTAGATACAGSLSESTSRTAVLVLADGSATRGPRAPGGEDPRGGQLDALLVQGLRTGRLAMPSEAEAAAVGCRGLPGITLFVSLQVAGSAAGTIAGGPTTATHPDAVPVDVRYEGAPTGVGYLVAVRSRRV